MSRRGRALLSTKSLVYFETETLMYTPSSSSAQSLVLLFTYFYFNLTLTSFNTSGEDDVLRTAPRLSDAAINHPSDGRRARKYPLPTEREPAFRLEEVHQPVV